LAQVRPFRSYILAHALQNADGKGGVVEMV
jgi:hypothetical protein